MKYSEKYNKVDEEWKMGGMFQSKEDSCCLICNEATPWIDPTFLVVICSDECYTSMWKTFKEESKNGTYKWEDIDEEEEV